MDYRQMHFAEDFGEDYRAGRLSRREFLRRLALLTGGTLAAASLAGVLSCGETGAPEATATPTAPPPTSKATPAAVATARPEDAGLSTGPVQFPGDGVTLLGYLAQPKTPGPHPGVLLIHENRGLLPHFPDVARRLAQAGYVALALDLVSREGGSEKFTDPAQAGAALRRIPQARLLEDMNSGVRYLQNLPTVRRDRIGAVGFCFGGGLVWLLSVRNPELKAAVPFYGSRPPLDEVPNLRAAVLGIYADLDTRINAGVPELEAALKQQNKTYQVITYQGARHSFFNDTGERYHPEAAAAAWKETLAWFDRYLKG